MIYLHSKMGLLPPRYYVRNKNAVTKLPSMIATP
jgi:hypothetical protein